MIRVRLYAWQGRIVLFSILYVLVHMSIDTLRSGHTGIESGSELLTPISRRFCYAARLGGGLAFSFRIAYVRNRRDVALGILVAIKDTLFDKCLVFMWSHIEDKSR